MVTMGDNPCPSTSPITSPSCASGEQDPRSDDDCMVSTAFGADEEYEVSTSPGPDEDCVGAQAFALMTIVWEHKPWP